MYDDDINNELNNGSGSDSGQNGWSDGSGVNNGGQNGYGTNGDPYNNPYLRGIPRPEPNQALISAAFVLGILSIVTAVMMTVYIPFILGTIAIMLAILSRKKDGALHRQARLGIILSVIGLVMNTVIVASSVYTVFNDPDVREEFNTVCEQMYGQSFDDMMETIKEGGEVQFDYSGMLGD